MVAAYLELDPPGLEMLHRRIDGGRAEGTVEVSDIVGQGRASKVDSEPAGSPTCRAGAHCSSWAGMRGDAVRDRGVAMETRLTTQ